MVSVLGVDIGGSKTQAVLADLDGRQLATATVGSANHQSVGFDGALQALDELAAALPSAPAPAVVYAGAAGTDTPAIADFLVEALASRFTGGDPSRVVATHDTRILLAAGRCRSGCVAICGTGSVAWALGPAGQARAGGWGPALGDDGSGYGIARDTVRSALSDADHGRPVSRLTRALLDAVSVEAPADLLECFYARPERAYWAGLAGLVCDRARAGDVDAERIIAAAVSALSADIGLACSRAGVDGPILLAGGFITHHSDVAAALTERLTGLGLRDISLLDREPVWGAVDLACSLAREAEDA